ncbi:hypothetical protein GJAV_G00193750 [Gymnothorax javanicus]|nr:hypothetical protein GJAV_G00193750 [Gymnothorax javanicus]
MIFSNRWAGYTRAFRRGPCQKINTALRYCWDAYSKPVPETVWEGLTLLGLCFLVSLVTGGFLFHWMSEVLRYGQTLAATVAGLYGAAALFLLFLVHPLRCILTLVMPTLGTKQGRKLIISTSMMLLALNVVPNIASNVGVMAHILKCTGSGLAQSLINSSEVVNTAREDLINEVREARSSLVPTLTEFHHDTNINVSEVKQRFVDVSQHIENDFAHAKRIMDEIKLLANRLIASIFVIYLLVEGHCT